MKYLKLVTTAITLVLSTSTNAALVERLGGLAYYDTEADLTWLADANAAVGSTYDTHLPGTGRITWDEANAWVAGLNVEGVTGWRLPTTIDVDNDGPTQITQYQGVDHGYNITAHSEMSNLFFNVLGNTSSFDINGELTGCGLSCTTNSGPFVNIMQANDYWSETLDPRFPGSAWVFNFGKGQQGTNATSNAIHAWAVHSGDVSVVPVPAAVWLFGSGLVGIIGVARRKKTL